MFRNGFVLALIFVASVFCSSNADAVSYIKGSARFSAQKGDSLRFIKSQLQSKSIENIIDKELKKMGHDNFLFWRIYHQKFELYFSPILEKFKVKNKMDMDDLSKISAKKKQDYFKALRIKKLKLRARFGRLDKVISSYAIVKMSRSSQVASSRYMKIKAVVNRKKLNKLYFKFIRTEESRFFKNLFISTEFHLTNLSWSDLGVEVERDLKDVITEHWKRWFTDNLKNTVGNIIIASESDNRKLEERFKMPMKEISMITNDKVENEKSIRDESNDILGLRHMMFEDPTMGSLWLKININLDGKSVDELLKIHDCHISGDFVLIDMNNNQLIDHLDFVNDKINIFPDLFSQSQSESELARDNALSSKVAGMIYRIPMDKFSKFPKILSSISNTNRFLNITIKNVNSMGEVYSFNKLLQERGVVIDASFKVTDFSRSLTKGVLNYKGKSSKLIEILSKLEGTKIFNNRVLKVNDIDRPFSFEIINSKGGRLQ